MSKISQQYLPLIAAGFTVIGLFLGKYLYQDGDLISIGSSNDGKVEEVISKVMDLYVDTVDQTEITDYAIEHLLQNLDPHSTYIPAKNVPRSKERMQGNFVGIGIEYRIIDDTLMVVSPIKGGPSESAGILAGDRFIGINNQEIELGKLNGDSLIDLLRGEAGTKVNILVYRPKSKKQQSILITRSEIPIYSIDASFLIQEEIGFIKINRFSQRTFSEFELATQTLIEKGAKKFILDVRGNPGGSLHSIKQICNEFLEKGAKILETKSKGEVDKTFADGEGKLIQFPISILIDQNSASASEILAGVMQDNDRATIVGRRTFGKGLVQQVITLDDRSQVNLTIARYYIPSGRCIQKPFEGGEIDLYHQERANRWDTGELYQARKLTPPDSLAFKTKEGRLVFGNEGVYPDVFVALDTTFTSVLLTEFLRKDVLRNLATKFYYPQKFNAQEYHQFIEEIQEIDFKKALMQYSNDLGIKWNERDWEISKEFIESRLTAYIVRAKFGNTGYYETIAPTDHETIQAIKALKAKN